jgi:hypothetical protein
MTKPNSSEIVVLLDRSGSMLKIQQDMEGGFDSFIDQQRKAQAISGGDCRVSLYQFDDVFDLVYVAKPVTVVPPLQLMPRANTALWDALGRAITYTGERFSQMPEHARPAKVVFVLITDGQENASREYTAHQVRSMIKHQEEKYSWGFIYLGSAPTTHTDAAQIGIRAASNYVASAGGVRGMSGVVGAAVASYCNDVRMDWAELSAKVPEKMPEHPLLVLPRPPVP